MNRDINKDFPRVPAETVQRASEYQSATLFTCFKLWPEPSKVCQNGVRLLRNSYANRSRGDTYFSRLPKRP